jgi:tetratricopeptide (TPR) repeat protein
MGESVVVKGLNSRIVSLAATYSSAAVLLTAVSACTHVASVPEKTESFVDVKEAGQLFLDPQIERSSSAIRHYLVGEVAIGNQQFDKALEHFEVASELTDDSSPSIHGTLAELYVRSGNLDEALTQSEIVRDVDPSNISNLSLYAGTLESMGRTKEAEGIYAQLIKHQPDNFDAYVLLSSLYNKRKAFNESINLLRRYEAKNPQHPLSFYLIGQAFELKGDKKEAENNYLRAYEVDPNKTNAAKEIIRLYLQQDRQADVEAFCRKLLEREPDNVLARKVLSHLFLGSGKFDDALDQLQILESVEGDSSETRFKIALIHLERQNLPQAFTALSLVLSGAPENHEARFYLGSVYASQGENDKAISELKKIPSKSEVYIKARTFMGFLYRQDGKLKMAVNAIKQAHQKDKASAKLLSYLILLLRDDSRLDEAKKLLEDEIKESNGSETLWFHYAVVLNELEQGSESLTAMERVLEINPLNVDALNFVAYTLAESGGSLDKALAHGLKACELTPKDAYVWDTLGWVHYKRGELSDAESTLKKALSMASDVVILEHYAAVLLRQGNIPQAKGTLEQIIAMPQVDPASSRSSVSDLAKAKTRARELLVAIEKASVSEAAPAVPIAQ